MNRLIVISGCSSGGKSSLLSELNHQGYSVIPEVGREIVKEQLALKSNITPWQNPTLFCEMLIERSIAAFHRAEAMRDAKGQVVFLDRSFLEGISGYQTLPVENPNKYNHIIEELRYDSTVFMAPPWKEIYSQDEERQHSFEDAVNEYERLMKFYPQSGYCIIELPKISVKGRAQFVFSSILKKK